MPNSEIRKPNHQNSAHVTFINESPTELIWFPTHNKDTYTFLAPGRTIQYEIPKDGIKTLPTFFVAHLHKAIVKNGHLIPHHILHVRLENNDGSPITLKPGCTITYLRLKDYGEGGCRFFLQDKTGKEQSLYTDIEKFQT